LIPSLRLREIAEQATAVTEAFLFFIGLKLGWWAMGSEIKNLKEEITRLEDEVKYWRARRNSFGKDE
jgi:hypothetical protein